MLPDDLWIHVGRFVTDVRCLAVVNHRMNALLRNWSLSLQLQRGNMTAAALKQVRHLYLTHHSPQGMRRCLEGVGPAPRLDELWVYECFLPVGGAALGTLASLARSSPQSPSSSDDGGREPRLCGITKLLLNVQAAGAGATWMAFLGNLPPTLERLSLRLSFAGVPAADYWPSGEWSPCGATPGGVAPFASGCHACSCCA